MPSSLSGYNITTPYPAYRYIDRYERLGQVGQVPNVQTVFLGYDTVYVDVNNPGPMHNKYRSVSMAGNTPNYRLIKGTPWALPANVGSDDHQETEMSLELVQNMRQGYSGEFERHSLVRVGSFSAAQYFGDPDPASHLEVQAKFFAKVNDVDVHAGVFLAEASKTSAMIRKTAKRLADCLVNLRKLKIMAACRAIGVLPNKQVRAKSRLLRHIRGNGRKYRLSDKELSDLFLELQFGWLPLLSDAEGAGKALAKITVDPSRTDWFHISKLGIVEKTTIIKDTSVSPPVTTTAIVKKTIKYGGWIRYKRAVPEAINKLGLTDLAGVAWELTPWSFVFDWLANINDMITASTALSSYEFSSMYASNLMTSECVATRQTTNGYAYPDRSFVYVTRAPRWRRRRFNRFSWSPSVPSFRFKNDPLNLRRTASAVALAVQRVKSS